MKTASENVLVRDEKVEIARQDEKAELVEMGRVSETKGTPFGVKQDVGAGMMVY